MPYFAVKMKWAWEQSNPFEGQMWPTAEKGDGREKALPLKFSIL